MSWILIALFLISLTINNGLAEDNLDHHEKKFPSAVVVGTVYCDTCFQQVFSRNNHFISGASVAVECKGGSEEESFREEVKTDNYGEFKVRLPFLVAKHVRKIDSCSVELIGSSDPYCSVTSKTASNMLRLLTRKQGDLIFSAGFFTFKPLEQPNSCNENPMKDAFSSKKPLMNPLSYLDPTFPPPIQDLPSPPFSLLPPLPLLPKLPPLPQLPPLPPLLGLPGLQIPIPPILGSTSP